MVRSELRNCIILYIRIIILILKRKPAAMETDPLEIHHVVIKSEVFEDNSDGTEIEPVPVIIKNEVFEDDSNGIEVEPTPVIIKSEASDGDNSGIEVKPTPHTHSPNVPTNSVDISCSSPSSTVATGTHLVSDIDCDFNQCCRICAQKSSDLISVFGEEGLFRQLTRKMKDCLQINVSASCF